MTPQSTTPADAATAPAAEAAQPVFDVREFARTARGSHRAELDLDHIADVGIPTDAARLIRILRDLERSTMHRMRNLLVTATHKDARVTAFLTTWAYEKFWIADALDAVLTASGNELAVAPEPGARRRRSARERPDRRGPVARAIAGNFAGVQLVAAHVAGGLIDEWISTAAYRRLAEIATALDSVVELVVDVKARHIRFLAEEAHRRLAESARARRLTIRTLSHTAWPIGSADLPAADRSFFETIVFGGTSGGAEAGRISGLTATLPGLTGFAPTVAARLVP